MIREIQIENFKSIKKMKLELGRVNVFIGENGSGKSNILEAVALAGAATANKLDNEFLASRGIRATEPQHMRCALSGDESMENIQIRAMATDGTEADFALFHDGKPYSHWKQVDPIVPFLSQDGVKAFSSALSALKHVAGLSDDGFKSLLQQFSKSIKSSESYSSHLENFVIYSPENDALRMFQREGQIEPLGIHGEGLLKLLQVMAQSPDHQQALESVRARLRVLGWFEDLRVPDPSVALASKIEIKDRYLRDEAGTLDQISANEGFLFLLFYFCLFSIELTPRFFAIDNVDASLNPKLCSHLVKQLAELANENDKQVILTTHNPATLDGLDLNDDEQRLFVITRGDEGETKIRRIKHKDGSAADVKLSTAFINGYLGGLPKNF